MCQSILASIDGRIEITIGEKRGTTFRVVLRPAPRARDQKPRRPSSTTPLPPPAVPARRARVLVIDDDPGVASALRAMLEAHHEVKSVESARDGLQILLGDEEFDVVFCDLVMPDLSGIDVYCALELNRPERVRELVFMTGGVFTPDAERFLSQVQNPRIEKPFSLTRVEDLLARAVAARTESTESTEEKPDG
jgi:DNA-binding NtrC family response regulator